MMRRPGGFGWSIKLKTALILMICVTIGVAATGIGIILSSYRMMTSQLQSELIHSGRAAVDALYTQFDSMNNTMLNILSNDAIYNRIERLVPKDDTLDEAERRTLSMDIEAQLTKHLFFDLAWSSRFMNSIGIILPTGEHFIKSRYQLDKVTRDFDALLSAGMGTFGISKPQSSSDNIVYFRSFTSRNDVSHALGQLMVRVDHAQIAACFQGILGADTTALMYGADGGLLFSMGDPALEALSLRKLRTLGEQDRSFVQIGGAEYLHAVYASPSYDFTTAVLIPRTVIGQRVMPTIRNYLWIVALVMIATLAIALLLAHLSTRHIFILIDSIERIRKGDYQATLPDFKEKELASLALHFNRMTCELNRLINEVYKKELLLGQARLNMLQMQMNPHFIFNILSCIGIKARQFGAETVYEMTSSLSKMLKTNIITNPESQYISLRDELQNVHFYVYLQNQRFGDKIELNIELASDELMNARIPKLSIQPLVENSIVHGFEANQQHLHISLTFCTIDSALFIQVIDDGIGFDTSTLDLDACTPQAAHHSGMGIALSNTHNRIKLLYGQEYGLEIQSWPGEGTTVTLHMPIEMESSDV